MGGSNKISGTCFFESNDYCGGQPGVYGTLGTPAAGNLPGSREGATSWMDSSGNLWLFGGYVVDATHRIQYSFNDFWKFDPSIRQWAWMGGSRSPAGSNCIFDPNSFLPNCGQAGVYGALGTPSVLNNPGGRKNAAGWVEVGGNFWLFGGSSFDADGYPADLNDLWKLNPATSEWTWMNGNSFATAPGSSAPSPGVYGTLAIPAAGNIPGGRAGSTVWTDKSGNIWLFDGNELNRDLWEFNPTANEWAWMGGPDAPPVSAAGVYGTLGTPAAANIPGSRYGTASWIDNAGNLWLFGGLGYNTSVFREFLSDLWEYKPVAPAPVPSFILSAWPTSVDVVEGSTGVSTISTMIGGGFSSAVSFTVTGQPTGLAISFSPASITGASSTKMTASVGSGVVVGTYPLTVTGTAGSVTETTTVSLIVTAPPPSFTLAASPASLAITSGGQGSVTLTVTPQNGFISGVSFACSGLPFGASCSFNPATVTPLAGAVGTTQVAITTRARASSLPDSRPFFPVAAMAAALCLFGRRSRRGLLIVLFALTFAGIGVVIGCGGGGAAGGGSTPPPVTSTVTITATSGPLQQTSTLSLTVN